MKTLRYFLVFLGLHYIQAKIIKDFVQISRNRSFRFSARALVPHSDNANKTHLDGHLSNHFLFGLYKYILWAATIICDHNTFSSEKV